MIVDVEVLSEYGWIEAELEDGIWKCSDISVRIGKNGEVSVYGEDTEICAIRVNFVDVDSKDSLVLGDAWERAYGNLGWRKTEYSRKIPWYFLKYKDNKIYGYGVKTLPNSLCSWQCDEHMITLNIDVRNGSAPIILNGRTIEACTIVTAEYDGDMFDAARAFCGLMSINPRIPNRPIFGGNDWYCNYGDNSFDKILLHTKRVVECSKNCSFKPYMVIDDGWEFCHHQSEDVNKSYNGGPWRYCNDNFGDMKKMADAIKDSGAIPGIWFRPLWTVEKFPDNYVLKTDGMKRTLDISLPEVLDIIREDVKRFVDWGYKLIKHDFSTWDIFGQWGFEMEDDIYKEEVVFSDKTKTTAEIIKNMYLAIREAAGDDTLVMGCNTISHLSAGIFDIQRTGDDTSGIDWERTKKYGINTLAFRMPQHNIFYAADADCVGITNKINWEKNCQWLDVIAKSCTPLFVSIAEDSYTNEVKANITTAFERLCKVENVSRPLDWLESKTPNLWESDFGIDKYEW